MKKLEKIYKKPWPYYIGGIILGILNILILFTVGKAMRVSTGFLYWGTYILNKIGINTNDWYYFKNNSDILISNEGFIDNFYTPIIIAIMLGSLISILFSSEFKVKKIKNKKQLFFGLFGGILMGYGTRIAFGCNLGAFFSAIPSGSLHGWVFGIFMLLGAFIGSKILLKFIL
ncbi:YeeE/YedE thiosulfate transporter family protein [Senegalia massiliensis]|uniref:YeeE/YedE thiosulfate transporter family protein n=1 Tax=Senegalia massiliensis TaxID=1720316 RepID=UPI00103204BB|nr:YeeE/YedE thiosulfate transporter family protein [Senegalia massiliensis]